MILQKKKQKNRSILKSWIKHREKTLLPERKSVAGI